MAKKLTSGTRTNIRNPKAWSRSLFILLVYTSSDGFQYFMSFSGRVRWSKMSCSSFVKGKGHSKNLSGGMGITYTNDSNRYVVKLK